MGRIMDKKMTNIEKLASEIEEPFYKGDGEHSIYELQKLCNEFKEYCYQKQLTYQQSQARILELEENIKNLDRSRILELAEQSKQNADVVYDMAHKIQQLESELKMKAENGCCIVEHGWRMDAEHKLTAKTEAVEELVEALDLLFNLSHDETLNHKKYLEIDELLTKHAKGKV